MEFLIALVVGAAVGVASSCLQLWLAERRSKQRKRDIMKDYHTGYLND
jgi:gas vesicle protein